MGSVSTSMFQVGHSAPLILYCLSMHLTFDVLVFGLKTVTEFAHQGGAVEGFRNSVIAFLGCVLYLLAFTNTMSGFCTG